MAKRLTIGDDFVRALDEFFDEMLISRWRKTAEQGSFENTQVADRGDHYEVRVVVPGAEPGRIEVELSGQRLRVRASATAGGVFENSYAFNAPIDADRASARCDSGMLLVTLPKQKPKRIKVGT